MRVEQKRQEGREGAQRHEGWHEQGDEERDDRDDETGELEENENSHRLKTALEEVCDETKRAISSRGGPLEVALGGTIWHLTTDAHELNKLSFPCLSIPLVPPCYQRVQPACSLIKSQMMEGQRGVEKKYFH